MRSELRARCRRRPLLLAARVAGRRMPRARRRTACARGAQVQARAPTSVRADPRPGRHEDREDAALQGARRRSRSARAKPDVGGSTGWRNLSRRLTERARCADRGRAARWPWRCWSSACGAGCSCAPARGRRPRAAAAQPRQRLDIRPESLPDDVGDAAARAVAARRAARRACRCCTAARCRAWCTCIAVPIRAASTEGECVALAAPRLDAPVQRFFARLVDAWQLAVYGARLPSDGARAGAVRRFRRAPAGGRAAGKPAVPHEGAPCAQLAVVLVRCSALGAVAGQRHAMGRDRDVRRRRAARRRPIRSTPRSACCANSAARRQARRPEALPPPRARLVLLTWHWDVLPEPRRRAARWVEGGGHLVVPTGFVGGDAKPPAGSACGVRTRRSRERRGRTARGHAATASGRPPRRSRGAAEPTQRE